MAYLQNPHRRPEAGSASVELGLLLPMLAFLLVGGVDFARLFYNAIAVANAARAGVQYGAQSAANSQDISGMIQAALQDAQDLSGVQATAERYCECMNGVPADCNSLCNSGKSPRVYIKVSVTKNFQTLFPYPGVPHTVNISQNAVMQVK